MIVFLSGMVTGDSNYKHKFDTAERVLLDEGHIVINPTALNKDLPYETLMSICFSMIDISDAVVQLPDWKKSDGATREHEYVQAKNATGSDIALIDYMDIIGDRHKVAIARHVADLRGGIEKGYANDNDKQVFYALKWILEVL